MLRDMLARVKDKPNRNDLEVHEDTNCGTFQIISEFYQKIWEQMYGIECMKHITFTISINKVELQIFYNSSIVLVASTKMNNRGNLIERNSNINHD